MRWRLKSPAPRSFTQPFIQARIKENITAPVTGLSEGNSPATTSIRNEIFRKIDAIIISASVFIHRLPFRYIHAYVIFRDCLRYEWNLALQWRHNERDGVSNHRCLDCLLNCLFRRKSKKTSKLRVTGLYEGKSPHKGPVKRKLFPWRHHGTIFIL